MVVEMSATNTPHYLYDYIHSTSKKKKPILKFKYIHIISIYCLSYATPKSKKYAEIKIIKGKKEGYASTEQKSLLFFSFFLFFFFSTFSCVQFTSLSIQIHTPVVNKLYTLSSLRCFHGGLFGVDKSTPYSFHSVTHMLLRIYLLLLLLS